MTDHADVRHLLGAYVLGGLDDQDRRTVDAHLATCPHCRAEVVDAAPLPDLLRKLPPEPLDLPEPRVDAEIHDLLHRMRAHRTAARRRTRTLLAASAAAVVVVVGGLSLYDPTQPATPGTPFVASGATPVTGKVSMTGKPWGTSLEVALSDMPKGGRFILQVRGVNGTVEQAATWAVDSTTDVRVMGACSMKPERIQSLRVMTVSGQVIAESQVR